MSFVDVMCAGVSSRESRLRGGHALFTHGMRWVWRLQMQHIFFTCLICTMENPTTNATLADPEAPASSSSNASNVDIDRKGLKAAGLLCSSSTATRLALALSFSTFLIGLTLFIYSLRKSEGNPVAITVVPEPTLLLDRNETEAYWLRLQSEVLIFTPSQQQVLIPDSSVWKALKWMALKDPLRPLPSGWQTTQRYTMVVLFYHWTGDSAWDLLEEDGWIQEPQLQHHTTTTMRVTKEHECEWKGVECNSDRQVTSLLLDSEQTTFVLNGQIPTELGLLTSLEKLDVTGHMLKGVFPLELASLASTLKSLHVAFNHFTSLDDELMGQLTSLETLHLSDNLLRGTLPTSMMNLGKLRVLNVAKNDALTGNALVMMNAWPNLQELDVSNTRIGGSIPDQIGNWSSLELLDLGFSPVRVVVLLFRFPCLGRSNQPNQSHAFLVAFCSPNVLSCPDNWNDSKVDWEMHRLEGIFCCLPDW
jgi:Leucine-rich repeat (LRR) protein